MNLSAVPRKCTELSKLPIKDVKTRRLFILADGKRSLAEVFRLSMIDQTVGIGLVQSLLDGEYLLIPELDPGISEPDSRPREHAEADLKKVNSTVFIEGLTEELSKYVGPFAAVVMRSFHLTGEEVGSEERRRIISMVVEEIEEQQNKQRFLSAIKLAGLH